MIEALGLVLGILLTICLSAVIILWAKVHTLIEEVDHLLERSWESRKPEEKPVETTPQYNASYGDPEIKMYLDQQFSRKGE